MSLLKLLCFLKKNLLSVIENKGLKWPTTSAFIIYYCKLTTHTTASCWEPQYCLTIPELYRMEEFIAFRSLKFRLMALRRVDDKLISSMAQTSSDLPE